MNTIYLNAKDVPQYLRGDYTGKKFSVNTSTEGYIPNTAGLWEGGSRDTYKLIELSTGRSVSITDVTSAPWDASRTEKRFPMRPGFAIVCHSMFCGRDAVLTFTIHPDDATKMLPASGESLAPFESIVLKATREYKSSYNGQDRYQMAKGGISYFDRGNAFPSRSEWESAKQSLIARKFLNKAGAITPDGRNASNSL